jgi:hypothetical protein
VPARDVKVLSPTSIRFTAPPHAAGTADVTVTTPYGTSKAVPAARLTYVNPPRPVVTGLSTDQGPSNAATPVVVTGTDFLGATKVVIDQVPVTSFTVVSNTELRAVFPAQRAGTWVNVQVITPGGPSFASDLTDFKYVEPPKPTVTALSTHQGRTREATRVVVTGTNLTGTTAVTVAGVRATFTGVTATQLTITVPAHAAATGHVLVTTAAGTSLAAGDQTTFTWLTT